MVALETRNLLDIDYLRHGTPRQRQAWATLSEAGIFVHLAPFSPVLTGTIPIELDTINSDLDVICQADDLERLERVVTNAFGRWPSFSCHRRTWQGRPSVVAGFNGGDFPIQIFAQNWPVIEQNAFRHMLVEARLLEIGGPDARTAIMALRRAGVKTEPAFARYFGLDGDPYQVLFDLSQLDDVALRALLATKDRRSKYSLNQEVGD